MEAVAFALGGDDGGDTAVDCLVAERVQLGEAAQLSGLPASGTRSRLPFSQSGVILTLEVPQIMGGLQNFSTECKFKYSGHKFF